MSAREEVLGRIRTALGSTRAPVPDVARDYRQADDRSPAALDLYVVANPTVQMGWHGHVLMPVSCIRGRHGHEYMPMPHGSFLEFVLQANGRAPAWLKERATLSN